MLKGKSESLKESYESNIKKLIPFVANDSYLVGLVEGLQTSQRVETQEETIMKEMNKLKISKGLTEMLTELKNSQDRVLNQLQRDMDRLRQFTIDFPDIYVLENDGQKKDRLRRQSNTRKVPQEILKTLKKGAEQIKEQVDIDNSG